MARLFIPGPTDVDEKILKAMQQPMIGHRSDAFADLFARIQPRLRETFQTKNRVFVTTSSGTGLFEGAMRNMVSKRILIGVCGAFGQRWVDVANSNELSAERVDSKWGEPNLPETIISKLKSKRHDTLALVHNETSTGVENPIAKIIAEARAVQPDIIIMVDAVSSAGGVDIRTDDWGIDILITSSHKCMALPPGLAFAAVSDRAMQRAHSIKHRGYYFDFLLLDKHLQRNMTPATPAISFFYALDAQLKLMQEEGLSNRFNRHTQMAAYVQHWAKDRFDLFAVEGYRSKTVTAIRNTRGISISDLNKTLSENGQQISNGYGKLKNETFRIAHMGEMNLEDIKSLLDQIDTYLSHPNSSA